MKAPPPSAEYSEVSVDATVPASDAEDAEDEWAEWADDDADDGFDEFDESEALEFEDEVEAGPR